MVVSRQRRGGAVVLGVMAILSIHTLYAAPPCYPHMTSQFDCEQGNV